MRHLPSVLASAIVVTLSATSGIAHAQEASPTGKGVIGGALLGAELVLAIEAAFDVQSTWAYIGGGVAGAVAGGVGGYFIERDSTTRLPMIMLAGGMALAIPTTVAVLSATSYEPPADYVQDTPPTDEPVADPPRPDAPPTGTVPRQSRSVTPGEKKRARTRAPALLDFEPTQVTLSVPAVELRDVYTQREIAELGVSQATEVRIPVVSVLF
ncbi:MAG TPA: hypothetical protein VER33_06690 [Polyangiaceae bacterium]|nr:hypothetical protein [Polyangiaceae bacterium]